MGCAYLGRGKSMQTDCIGGSSEYTEAFCRFWSAYPRKVAKSTAYQSWVKNGLEFHADAICAHVEAKIDSGKWDDPQYIPHPTTYLNQQRWTDEVDAPKPKAPKRATTIDCPPECPKCNAVMRWDGTCAFGCVK